MAIENRTDLDQAARVLPDVLQCHLSQSTKYQVSNVRMPQEAGMSNETLMFDASWIEGGTATTQSLVARIAPRGDGIYFDYDIEREFRLMSTLSRNTDLPVPGPLFFEPDVASLGAPFFVMPFIQGRGLADDPPYTVEGWLTEVDADDRARLIDNTLRMLAAIHAVDWQKLGLGPSAHADSQSILETRLAHEERFYAWASDGQTNPVIESALAWLRSNAPDAGPLVLNWGDARISNAIYDDDLRIAGVLDWERASIANPEQDLGWWLFSARHHTAGIGVPEPAGFPDPATLVARYEQLSGHECRNIEFYEVLAGVQASNMMMRAAHMLTLAGFLPADNSMALNNPASVLLAELIGAAPLAGQATSFIGNRE